MDQQQQLSELKAKLAQLKGEQTETTEPTAPAAVNSAVEERRAHFTGSQRRLADILAVPGNSIHGGNGFHLIDGNNSDVQAISDKLVVMQIVGLMADDDGSDGILNIVYGWTSKSQQSLAERIGDHPSLNECNPAYRLRMQPESTQRAYRKRQAELVKLPYEPKPELKVDPKALVRMSSDKFAEFTIEFHRKVLDWDLKQYIYDNLTTPAPEFFAGFLGLQRDADAEEEELFKNAMAAHIVATAPDASKEEAEDFLGLIAWMGQRTRLEELRRQERIAKQKPRSARDTQTVVPAAEAPKEWGIRETKAEPAPDETLKIDFDGLLRHYDRRLAEIKGQTA